VRQFLPTHKGQAPASTQGVGFPCRNPMKWKRNKSKEEAPKDNIYVCKCLDAKYDQEDEVLVLNCMFEELKEQKIVIFHRKDFNFKGGEVPHLEMHRTAALFRGKRFKLDVGNDPLRKQLSPEEQMQYARMFREEMSDEMGKVCEGLADDTKQIQRKLGRMVDEGKIDPMALIKEEMVIRGKINGMI